MLSHLRNHFLKFYFNGKMNEENLDCWIFFTHDKCNYVSLTFNLFKYGFFSQTGSLLKSATRSDRGFSLGMLLAYAVGKIIRKY